MKKTILGMFLLLNLSYAGYVFNGKTYQVDLDIDGVNQYTNDNSAYDKVTQKFDEQEQKHIEKNREKSIDTNYYFENGGVYNKYSDETHKNEIYLYDIERKDFVNVEYIKTYIIYDEEGTKYVEYDKKRYLNPKRLKKYVENEFKKTKFRNRNKNKIKNSYFND